MTCNKGPRPQLRPPNFCPIPYSYSQIISPRALASMSNASFGKSTCCCGEIPGLESHCRPIVYDVLSLTWFIKIHQGHRIVLPPGEFPVNSPRSRPGRLGVCFHIWLLLFLPQAQGRRQPPQHTFIHAQVRNTGVIPQIVWVCECRIVLIGSWLVIWDLTKVRPT